MQRFLLGQAVPREWAYHASMNSDLSHAKRLEEAVTELRCPAIVLQGGADIVVSPAAGRSLAARLDAELVELAGQGHLLPRDAPESIAAAVGRLIDGAGAVGWGL